MLLAVTAAFVGNRVIGVTDGLTQRLLRDFDKRNRGLKARAIGRIFRHGFEQSALIDRIEDGERFADGA